MPAGGRQLDVDDRLSQGPAGWAEDEIHEDLPAGLSAKQVVLHPAAAEGRDRARLRDTSARSRDEKTESRGADDGFGDRPRRHDVDHGSSGSRRPSSKEPRSHDAGG
jgi:hypothetical protein